jgi:putative tryptophan/tyrosine transport system substrate-binding protein
MKRFPSKFLTDNRKSAIQNPKWWGLWIIACGLIVVAGAAAARAQQPAKAHRVCFLSSRSGIEAREEAFRQGLRELGYIEGKNIGVEWRFAKGNADRFSGLAAELIQGKCDVVVAGGTEAAKALKNVTGTIPVVFTVASDPVGAGLVDSLARPGANVTGLSLDAPGLGGKRLEILKESLSRLTRSAVLFHRASPASKLFLAEIEEGARLLKVQIQPFGVETESEIGDAFKGMTKERADGLVKLPSGLLTSLRKPIVDLAAKNRLPAIYEDRIIVEDGGLMSYGPDITDLYRRSALLVDKILKGRKPAELPVEQPTKFEFVVNLKAAKQIGLTIPPNVLARADRVIK